jgi:uncharacterized protein involved in exopolysaccharide biosynthesis
MPTTHSSEPIPSLGSPQDGRGIFDPPSGTVAPALRRHKLLIIAFALVFALIGFGAGFLRQPTYTGSASLQVGQVNPNSPGFLGYTQSATSLAAVFSRAIYAQPVLKEVEEKLGLSSTAATERLTAEPIPLSPLFRIVATGSSGAAAIHLANVASAAVIGYVGKTNSANPQATTLLHEALSASIGLRRTEAALNAAEAESSGRLKARAAKSVAQLRLEAISKSYIETVGSQAPRAGLLSLVAGATSASDDRRSKAELYTFLGLILGLVAGCAVAVLAEQWRTRKELSLASAGRS